MAIKLHNAGPAAEPPTLNSYTAMFMPIQTIYVLPASAEGRSGLKYQRV